MANNSDKNNERKFTPYLSGMGAWALAFGCAVGWGSFVMPGSTFLPVAGPAGTAIGIAIGAAVMLIFGANYHYLMNRFSGSGGVYTYAKENFGHDHGFVSAWFLILTYIAIIWANATALPLIARTLLGSTFQFGFEYEIAGFHVWLGEILLSVAALVIAALFCLRRKLASHIQIIMAVLLFAGVVICFVAAAGNSTVSMEPAFAPGNSASGGIFTIFALTPWAFVGFESISHSTAEARFKRKRTFAIIVVAVVTSALAYIFLSEIAVTALPEGVSSWPEYMANLGNYSGVASQPTFFAANSALGSTGSVILGIAALCGIFTGLIGNYIALSRLIVAMTQDGMLKGRIGEIDRNHVPRRAIIVILLISIVLPFFGRTAISWIVDVTTIGATIAYAYASASALKTARKEKNKLYFGMGIAGIAAAALFGLEFLIPNLSEVKTLSMQSYFILAAWGILGLLYFRRVFRHDKERNYGRSVVVWVVMLAMIIFSSTVWMIQETETALEESTVPIQSYYTEKFEEAGVSLEDEPGPEYMQEVISGVRDAQLRAALIQMALIVVALLILFNIYHGIQKREKQIEVEKLLAEESSRAKTSFLSNMSHEIRTPMNAIIGLDNIALRNPDLTPQTREQLEKIGASAKHLLGLINDILDMSRIESGRVVLKNEEFSFREFLDQINIIINGQCLDKGLHYECHIKGHVSDYYIGDDLKLKQVLINILGNSVKFTNAPGEVSLTVEEIGAEGDQRTLRFLMKDTGIGMDKEFIPKIFEAFSQENANVATAYGSTGLGMAITKNFVEMMNGDIVVESEKGVGSEFAVTVTLGGSDRIAKPEKGIVLPKNLRAFVVDDDEIACEHCKTVLNAIGIEADTSVDPEEAIDLIREAHGQGTPYALLFTDFKMPAMNGLDLARSVHAFAGEETSIIMLTGYNWDNISEEARKDGVDAILAKPLFSDSLQREVHHILQKKAGDDFVEVPEEETEEETVNVLAGKHILMAEDVEQNAEILLDLLELEDMTAEHAENGEIAVKLFSESEPGHFDVILMDVRMPVMDGLSATRAIRALDRPDAKTIPIIAMTANVFDEDVERSHQAGMNAHLAKPIEPERMYETMAKFIMENES